jgi:eukaryotic-like serine/threonine-protein kinase
MGAVFLGRAPDGTAVAIKVIRPELAQRPEFRARFRREADSARRVRRFTTAAVLDADPDGPQPYLVTEYVEGPTLAKLVARRGPMRPTDLEQLALSVATALSAIHTAGIVHRDLTPANVLLSPVGPKVIDFGLAREFDSSSEISRNVRQAIGTPGYMSPEQILDDPITSAADVFAWGAVTVFAATGAPPFGEGQVPAMLYRIVHDPPRTEGLPGELRGLVEAAMRKDPATRPDAEQLRVALMGGVTATPAPVSTAPPTPASGAVTGTATRTAVTPGPAIAPAASRSSGPTVISPAPAISSPPPVVSPPGAGSSAAPVV